MFRRNITLKKIRSNVPDSACGIPFLGKPNISNKWSTLNAIENETVNMNPKIEVNINMI